MFNTNYIAVYDYETGSLRRDEYSPVELGCIILDPRTLEKVPNGQFVSLMRPLDWSKVEDKALEINGITREELEKAPPQEIVWQQFVQFIGRFTKGKAPFGSPVAAGYNTRNFDNPITDAMCRKYGQVDKYDCQTLFNISHIDVRDMLFVFTESYPEWKKLSMDYNREFLEIENNGAHRALVDVEDTAKILRRFLNWVRKLVATQKFQGSFKGL